MFARVMNHENFMYYGEVAKHDEKTPCGKGMAIYNLGTNKSIFIGWFKNG